jgi:uncharacterized protein DUF7009
MQVGFVDNRICVRIPLRLAQDWANSDQISLSQDGDDGGAPFLLIEKDFQCLDREGRSQSEDQDSFPNPSGAVCCE